MGQGFDFYVKGIEDAVIAALEEVSGGAAGYARTIIPYRGELDDAEITRESRAALSKIVSRLPMFLIAYADGEDDPAAGYPWMFGEPREIVHRCTFVVVACAPDARGDLQGRTQASAGVGAYRMVADAQRALLGRQFERESGGAAGPVVLNCDPLRPSRPPSVRAILRLNEMTAMAVYFDTSFVYDTSEWGGPPAPVEAINFGIDPAGGAAAERPLAPGVHGLQ